MKAAGALYPVSEDPRASSTDYSNRDRCPVFRPLWFRVVKVKEERLRQARLQPCPTKNLSFAGSTAAAMKPCA